MICSKKNLKEKKGYTFSHCCDLNRNEKGREGENKMQEEILNSNVDDVDVDASYEDIRFGGGKEV